MVKTTLLLFIGAAERTNSAGYYIVENYDKVLLQPLQLFIIVKEKHVINIPHKAIERVTMICKHSHESVTICGGS